MAVCPYPEAITDYDKAISFSRPPRRVLIVSPHFPPINAPDHHRVRIALPYFARHGWQAEILVVRAEDVEGVCDPDLIRTLPPGLVVHRAASWPAHWTRRIGVGSLALRAYGNLRKRGSDLLAAGRFDLVFFSTTQFGVLSLGPYWKRRYGVPYVLDFQDEWCGSYYADHPQVEPPGGRIKFGLWQWIARQQKPSVIQGASQIISVSRRYNENLQAGYPDMPSHRFHELPFGATAEDFHNLDRFGTTQNLFDPGDGRRHWVYVGRGGADLAIAVGCFFAAVRRALDDGLSQADTLRLHFIGTSYAPGTSGRPSFCALAEQHGLRPMVIEHVARVPYFTALRCLRDASAVLVFGSDDSAYTASKIFPAILARKPLLGIFHEASSAAGILRDTGTGTVVTFGPGEPPEKTSERIFCDWIATGRFADVPQINARALAPFTAAAMTARLCRIFDAGLNAAACMR